AGIAGGAWAATVATLGAGAYVCKDLVAVTGTMGVAAFVIGDLPVTTATLSADAYVNGHLSATTATLGAGACYGTEDVASLTLGVGAGECPLPRPETACPADVDVITDTDGDGLTDYEESMIGTDPLDPDTDGDRLEDGDEVDRGTDPLDVDTDDGGVDDGTEVLDDGTDPLFGLDDRIDAVILTTDPVRGEAWQLTVGPGTYGDRVWLMRGNAVGEGACPGFLGGQCWGVEDAEYLWTGTIGRDGLATWAFDVPIELVAGRTHAFQAVLAEAAGPVLTEPVEVTTR
ncbi:MAG: hypothetical protein ACI9K2_006547, partial [Myxococcota bacterium]